MVPSHLINNSFTLTERGEKGECEDCVITDKPHGRRDLLSLFFFLFSSLPELLVARPDPEPGPDEADQGLVLAQGERGAQQQALRVAQLGVQLLVRVRVVVGPEQQQQKKTAKPMSCILLRLFWFYVLLHLLSHHPYDAVGEAGLLPEAVDGVASVGQHVRRLFDMFLKASSIVNLLSPFLTPNLPRTQDSIMGVPILSVISIIFPLFIIHAKCGTGICLRKR